MNHELPTMPEQAPEQQETKEMLEQYINDLEREAVKKVNAGKNENFKQKLLRKITVWKILTILAIKL